MKYQVEWGIPVLDAPPAGRFGNHTCESATDAIRLAQNIAWTHAAVSADLGIIRTRNCPRVTWYNETKSFWVAISKLDGVPRGPVYEGFNKKSIQGEARIHMVPKRELSKPSQYDTFNKAELFKMLGFEVEDKPPSPIIDPVDLRGVPKCLTCNDPKDRADRADHMPAHIANRLWWKKGPDDEPIPFLDDL